MERPMPDNTKHRGRWGVYFKAMILVVLIGLLGIPTLFIDSLISERQSRRAETIEEISGKWGRGQTLAGPLLTIPYKEMYRDTSGKGYWVRKYIYVLPDVLKTHSVLKPEVRYRSIYEVAVYTSEVLLEGRFDLLGIDGLGVPRNNILWNEATVTVGITDLRGISEQVSMKWNGAHQSFNSGLPTQDVFGRGISSHVDLSSNSSSNSTYDFFLQLQLRGSEYIRFTPVGKITESWVRSSWTNPSFDGTFLPTKRTVSNNGFEAYWKVLHLNRSYPQMWLNDAHTLTDSDYGLSLMLPVDQYQKADRSIKYAMLFIGLTFLMFFFLELINGKLVHPFQYLLIGLALCLFYTLLISISEYLNYNIAYLIASSMTIGLITVYSASVLRARNLALMIGSTLVLLYGFIFCLIQLEDYALLLGSIGLFLILAATMYYSRRIDWAALTTKAG